MATFQHHGGVSSAAFSFAGAETDTTLVAAPGSGRTLVVHAITVVDKSGTTNPFVVETSGNDSLLEGSLEAGGEAVIAFYNKGLAVGDNLLIRLTSTGGLFVSVEYLIRKS